MDKVNYVETSPLSPTKEREVTSNSSVEEIQVETKLTIGEKYD